MSSITVRNLSIKHLLFNNPSPSLKELFANVFNSKNKSAYREFWAISDVSFFIQSGERVGIVGKNGAGKSTLLKVLANLYKPSKGYCYINGNVAPLLEIGAGFHPEFTGRENIYFNGTILGYKKSQLKKLEDEIIHFSELENFIDSPVKYYSTGMYMRLAFSLMTIIEPDILLLDEIFSGGDHVFVEKAKMRMNSLINSSNIMLMVSHDLNLLSSLCTRILWLDKGRLIQDGTPQDVIKSYMLGETTLTES